MKTKKIENVPSLQSVLFNPFYKGRIKKVHDLQEQADSFINLISFARGELAYAISQKLLKLVPKGPGKTLLEIPKGGSFIPHHHNEKIDSLVNLYDDSSKKKTRRLNLLCHLVNSALNRGNCMDSEHVFWGNGCVILTDYVIRSNIKTDNPQFFLQNTITIINDAWTKNNNNLGRLFLDVCTDEKEKNYEFRIIFEPGKEESKLSERIRKQQEVAALQME